MPSAHQLLPDWNHSMGRPGCNGRIKVEPGDFRVQELALITPAGEGSHLWLEIEKRNANTEWVARALAQQAGIPGRDVGFAGMKDRHGVTTQWFSVALQEARNPSWENWSLDSASILQAHLHGRKLKRGTLRGNRFRIRVRELDGETGSLDGRLQRLAAHGIPNYFGPQRFGHAGSNVQQGIRWLERGGRLPRNKRSIYLSAVRSMLFNRVLSRRVELGNWNHLLDGDIACLDGSRSNFPCQMPDPELERRCAEFDIHPSGPLPGRGAGGVEGEAAKIESQVIDPYNAVIEGLGKAGLKASRRSLRVLPAKMEWEIGSKDLVLKFDLPPGAYATSVIRELVTTVRVSISEAR